MPTSRSLCSALIAAALLGAGLLPASSAELQPANSHPVKKIVRHQTARAEGIIRVAYRAPLVLGIAY